MIVCDKRLLERIENEELSVIEKKRYFICQIAEKALGDIPIFYSSQPQGTDIPAVFVRIGKMQYKKRLGDEIECEVRFEARFLPKNSNDDIFCEAVMEKLMDALIANEISKISSERTKTGAVINADCDLRWIVEPDDSGDELMRILDMQKDEI